MQDVPLWIFITVAVSAIFGVILAIQASTRIDRIELQLEELRKK